MPMNDEKQQLRIQQKDRLTKLDPGKKKAESLSLYKQLFTSDLWQQAQTITVTLNLPIELDTQPIIQQAWELDKTVLIPKIIQKKMIFTEFEETTRLVEGNMHILEAVTSDEFPKEQIDLMIVPGLAFTKPGKRLGFGAGFYDRYLADFTGQTLSLSLNDQLLEQLPSDRLDVRIKQILTPED